MALMALMALMVLMALMALMTLMALLALMALMVLPYHCASVPAQPLCSGPGHYKVALAVPRGVFITIKWPWQWLCRGLCLLL